MIVSHSRKIIFVANPKTGSTSIEAALSGLNEEPELDSRERVGFYTSHHIPAATLREELGRSVWQSYFKFAFVRNPWDWFVSQHFYNLQKHLKPNLVNTPLSPEDVMRTERFLRIYRGCDWSETACQNAFVCDEYGSVLVDYLGRYENISRDFMVLSSMIGSNAYLPQLNTSIHRYYMEYYLTETRDLVSQLYARDIDLFGYTF